MSFYVPLLACCHSLPFILCYLAFPYERSARSVWVGGQDVPTGSMHTKQLCVQYTAIRIKGVMGVAAMALGQQ